MLLFTAVSKHQPVPDTTRYDDIITIRCMLFPPLGLLLRGVLVFRNPVLWRNSSTTVTDVVVVGFVVVRFAWVFFDGIADSAR